MNLGLGLDLSSSNIWTLKYTSASYNKSEVAVIPVTIRRTFLGVATVRLSVTGGQESADDFGFGPNYTGDPGLTWVNPSFGYSYTTVSFGALETEKTVSLQVINNPVFEEPRVLTLALSNASMGTIGGSNKTVTIVDDNVPLSVTVNDVTGYGLTNMVGDGSDETARLDAIRDYLRALAPTPGGIIKFPDGEYLIANHDLQPHVSYKGEGIGNTVIKLLRPPELSSQLNFSVGTKCRVTSVTEHGLSTGSYVFFYEVSQTAWADLMNWAFYVIKVDDYIFDIIRWKSNQDAYGAPVLPYSASIIVRALTKSTSPTLVRAANSVSTLINNIEAGDYVYFWGIDEANEWSVLNGNHYLVTSIKDADEFWIDFDSSDRTANWTYAVGALCGATFDSSALAAFTGTAKMANSRMTRIPFRSLAVLGADWTGLPIAFSDLTVDGNRDYFGPHHTYEQEQVGCIRFLGKTGAPDRYIDVNVENVEVRNVSGDGISSSGYCHFKGANITANSCWRLSIGTAGAKTNAKIRELSVPTDALHKGNYHQETVAGDAVEARTVNLTYGDFQIANQTNACTMDYSDIVANNLGIYGKLATVVIDNGDFTTNDIESYIFYPTDITIKNSVFRMSEVVPGSNVYLGFTWLQNGVVEFDTVEFKALTALTGDKKSCVFMNSCNGTYTLPITFTGCTFGEVGDVLGNKFEFGYQINSGGTAILTNCMSYADYLVKIYGVYSATPTSNYPCEVTLTGNHIGAGKYYAYIRLSLNSTNMTINHPKAGATFLTILDYPENQFVAELSGKTLADVTWTGGRQIRADLSVVDKADINGMMGDQLIDTNSSDVFNVVNLADQGYIKSSDMSIVHTTWTAVP